MRKLTAKKVYERVTLHKQQLSEEDHHVLHGTPWHHKVHGTTPDPDDQDLNFKTFYGQETIEEGEMTKAEMADALSDKIEDKFNLHFSNHERPAVDYETVKEYAHKILFQMEGHEDDRKSLASIINTEESVNMLLAKLYTISG
jgi:hypothetical protein